MKVPNHPTSGFHPSPVSHRTARSNRSRLEYLALPSVLLAALAPAGASAEVLAGWDTWASGSEPPSITATGVTGASSESGDWREDNRASSDDGTFGTLSGASTATAAASAGTFIGASSNGGTPTGAYQFSLTAGTDPLTLDAFHFDARRKRNNSATGWNLSVVAGSVSQGPVLSGTLGSPLGGVGPSDHPDFDVDLTSLADNELGPGESATFRLAFTGGSYSNTDQHTYLDNVAISGQVLASLDEVVKDDNLDDLNLDSSWVGGLVPTADEIAVWNATVVTGPNATTLGADLTWGGISVVDPAGEVTIEAGNTLTLGAAITDIGLGSATADLTLNCDLGMNGSNVWNIASGRTLNVNGIISGDFPITQQGAGTVVFSAANLYSGDTTVGSGTLRLGASDVIPDGTGTGNLTVDGTLDLNGNSEAINGLRGTGIIDNPVASTPSTLSVGGNNANSTFNGILQNSGGTLNLEKAGTGTLTLAGANTYNGTTTISSGTLEVGNLTALGDTGSIVMAGGTTLASAVDGVAFSAPIALGGTGTTATIDLPAAGASTLTLNGAISGDGNLRIDRSVGNVTAGTIILGGQNTYLGTTGFDTLGAVDSGSQLTVQLGIADALPSTTVLTLDGGAGSGSGRALRFDLNGFDQTLAGLTNVTGLSGRRQEVANTGAPATLTLNSDDDHSFGGSTSGTFNGNPWTARSRILGAISLVKSGAGTFTLVEVHGYTGDTTVNEGILGLEAPNTGNDASTVTIASGAKLHLNFTGTDTVGSLVIAGVPQGPGVYGHTDSGADNGGQGVGFFDVSFEPGAGTLTVPAPAGYASWAATNAGDQEADLDFDLDGVPNGVEYFMDAVAGFTLNPALDASNVITWPNGGNVAASEYGTQFVVQTSDDLVNWDGVPVGELTENSDGPGGSLTYTLTGPAPRFVRLRVTPN